MFYATAIKKRKKKGLLDMLNCLNWWAAQTNVTAIKISIMNNSRNLKKVCCVKGLIGSLEETATFIDKFRKKLEKTNGTLS